MQIPVTDESEFWQLAPAATEIFSYVEEESTLAQSPWGFDRGNMSEDLANVWAEFSCVSVNGWGKDVLYVTAVKQADGTWQLSHRVMPAG